MSEGGASVQNVHDPKGGSRSFLDRFQQFPNLFFQACVQKSGRNRLKSTLQTIKDKQARRQTDPEAPELQDEEDPENVAVLLLWVLGEKREAEIRAARAVQEHPHQLLALSNLAYILWHNGKSEEAELYLRTMEQLQSSDPSLYDDLDYEAQSELLYLYIKLGHSFKPFVVSEFQEKLLARRPQDSRLKFTLALTLRRYNQRDYTAAYPNVDFTKGLRRAADLFMEIKNDESNSLDLRGKAAAELGEIVSLDDDEKRRLGRSPRAFYEEAIHLAANNPPVLNRAGKFFRFEKDLNKSRELLERAIRVRPDPRAHHQLGLTFKQIALQQVSGPRGPPHGGRGGGGDGRGGWGRGREHFRGGDWRSGRGSDSRNWREDRRDYGNSDRGYNSRGNSYQDRGSYQRPASSAGGDGREDSQQPPQLSRDDRNVQQAIFHFRKSLEIQHADNMVALQDLGLILLDVGDYPAALKAFVTIAETWPVQIYYVHQAFENAGKALQAIRGGRGDLVYRETSTICFTLGLTIQCLSFLSGIESSSATLNPNFWASLGDLTTSLSDGKMFFQNLKHCGRDEKMLLKSLKYHMRSLPALSTTLSSLGHVETDRVEPVLETIEDLQARGDFAGALLLRSLLNMTWKSHGRFRITCDDVKGLLETAQQLAKLHYGQRESGSHDRGDQDLKTIVSQITLAASHVLCRQAFQDAVSLMKNSTSSKANNGMPTALADLRLSSASGVDQSQQVEEAASEDDVYSGNLHVLFLHDPQDQEAERDVSVMERLLEDVCGLKMSRPSGCAEESGEGTENVTERVCDELAVDDSAELRVFVLKSEVMSPEYTSLIQRATKANNSSREGAAAFTPLPPFRPSRLLLLNDAPLPETLNGHPFISSWKIPPEVQVTLSGSRSSSSRAEVETAYNLLDRLFELTET